MSFHKNHFPSASGRRMASLLLTAVAGLFCSHAALAQVTVASPVNGTTIASSAWVRAHNVGCNGLAPIAFAFSIDDSADVTWGVTPYDIDVVNYAIAPGTHTVHFKSWTTSGECTPASTAFNVMGAAPVGAPPVAPVAPVSSDIPSYAVGSNDLSLTEWQSEHDWGTPGDSQGSSVFPATTPSWDTGREMYMSYSYYGGQRWHLSFGNDGNAHNFVFDTYIYLANPDQVQNLELDMNQVTSNGETVIFGTQCSSISNTWEYTTVANNAPHWHASNLSCNPTSWAANTWHHIQIGYHRDDAGNVTHDWVNVDGNHSTFSGAVAPGGMWLGWANGALLANYQVDGALAGSGSITSYIHKTTIYRW